MSTEESKTLELSPKERTEPSPKERTEPAPNDNTSDRIPKRQPNFGKCDSFSESNPAHGKHHSATSSQ